VHEPKECIDVCGLQRFWLSLRDISVEFLTQDIVMAPRKDPEELRAITQLAVNAVSVSPRTTSRYEITDINFERINGHPIAALRAASSATTIKMQLLASSPSNWPTTP
jgi:hypothetical protein